MSIIHDQGFAVQAFEPTLAEAFGAERGREGANLIAEATRHQRQRVELCDWLYCLARSPKTLFCKAMVEGRKSNASAFVNALEQGLEHESIPTGGQPPKRLVTGVVSPAVNTMLEKASRFAEQSGGDRIREPELLRALLDAGDPVLVENLGYWATAEGLERFRQQIAGKPNDTPTYKMFGANGALELNFMSPSARLLCRRLAEDAASMRTARVTTRHVLYSLLSADSNVLVAALASIGITPKTELLPILTRELSRPGRGRLDGFRLTSDTVFGTVPNLFEHAHALAIAGGEAFVTERDIVGALLEKYPEEVLRLLPTERQPDITRIRAFIDSSSRAETDSAGEGPQLTVKEIEARIRKAILGQDQAIDKVMPWIKRLRFGLPCDHRPAAVLLLLGPTGAGKTQLAKELARHVFGSEEQLIFLEMGQFQTKESMSGFIGAPPGYVGYGEGLLTNGLRDKPQAVVLFDEIEKAHTQVFDTLLRFADEGLISDPAGPVRDGRRCIIVMTTNAGQDWLREHLAENLLAREEPKRLAERLFEAAMAELRKRGFRPEFLGRVDERITFLPFTEKACTAIVDDLLNREIMRFQELKGIDIHVSAPVREFLGKAAYKRSLDEGARGAPRAINEYIVTPVIDVLCEQEGKPERGAVKVQVSCRGAGDETRIIVEIVR